MFLSLVVAATASGCKKEPPPPPTVRVENPQLGVAIAALSPADFVLAANDGASIELLPAGEGASGTISVVAGEPEVGGINLVAAVQHHKSEVLEGPDGDYKGQTEYMSPLGTTFASRGRFSSDLGLIEERVVYMVHPWGDRTLQVIYRYPAADDTQARLDALMLGVVGELEALPAPEASPAAAADGS